VEAVGEVGAHVGEGCDQVGRVGGAEGGDERGERGIRPGGQAGCGGDPGGEDTQVGGVVAGPGGDGTVGGPAVAYGLDAFGADPGGGAGLPGRAQAQMAVLRGLAACDARGVGEVGPGGAGVAGVLDQVGLPAGELGAQFAQQQGGRPVLRAVRRASSMAASAVVAVRKDAGCVGGPSPVAGVPGRSGTLSFLRRLGVCHRMDDMLQRFPVKRTGTHSISGGVSRC
jgi:hypothetical protein